MTGPDYWRDVQKRMAAGGAYDHGTLDAHTVDPPGPDAWDECGGCGHDREEHDGPNGECEAGGTGCSCRLFTDEAGA